MSMRCSLLQWVVKRGSRRDQKERLGREKRLEEAENARKLVLSGRTSIGWEPDQWRTGLRFSQFHPPHKTRSASASQGVKRCWRVREHIHHRQTPLPTERTSETIVPYSRRSAEPTHCVSLDQEVSFIAISASPHPLLSVLSILFFLQLVKLATATTSATSSSSFSVLLSPIRIIENTQPCRKRRFFLPFYSRPWMI